MQKKKTNKTKDLKKQKQAASSTSRTAGNN